MENMFINVEASLEEIKAKANEMRENGTSELEIYQFVYNEIGVPVPRDLELYLDSKEETEEFYVNPIKEKAYELASHISQNGVIDENITNIIYDEMKKIIVDII